ncbi:hypothetical protein PJI17_06730 [Mycobacterium kansasii]
MYPLRAAANISDWRSGFAPVVMVAVRHQPCPGCGAAGAPLRQHSLHAPIASLPIESAPGRWPASRATKLARRPGRAVSAC